MKRKIISIILVILLLQYYCGFVFAENTNDSNVIVTNEQTNNEIDPELQQQQEELKNISAAYKKAQVDYGKTARKLTEVSRGNMSVADALGVKERADKQREKLMEASSRASEFYNNQKKGV